MERLIYSNPDGGVSVVIPAHDFGGSMNDLALSLNLPEDTAFAVVDETDIPADRTFRGAWRLGDHGINQDIEAAKDIWRNKWRAVRAPLLERLDTDMLRAIGDAEKRAEIEAKKQALRDVTQTALPDDIDEIKAVWPEILTT